MPQKRRRTVRARKRPTRKRSTRKGQVRKTARRAFVSKTKRPSPRNYRRRSNPKGIMDTAGFRYGTGAAIGAAAEVVINQTGFLAQTVPNRFVRSAIFALGTLLIARNSKGRRKEQLSAAAVGMVIPSLIAQVGTFQLGSNLTGSLINGSASNGRVPMTRRASISSPYASAIAHARQDSGLRAL